MYGSTASAPVETGAVARKPEGYTVAIEGGITVFRRRKVPQPSR